MSEVLGRTWALLMSSGTGPRWTVPSNQVSKILTFFTICHHLILVPVDVLKTYDINNYSFIQSTQTSHLPHGLAQFMKAVFEAPTLDNQMEIIHQQLNAVESKLKEPR